MEQKLESNTNLKSKFKNLYNLNKLKIFIIIGILIISVIFLIFLQINNKKRNLKNQDTGMDIHSKILPRRCGEFKI